MLVSGLPTEMTCSTDLLMFPRLCWEKNQTVIKFQLVLYLAPSYHYLFWEKRNEPFLSSYVFAVIRQHYVDYVSPSITLLWGDDLF